ncbi:MAG: tetratricopeptide repeat protein [Oscillospiraceae bacterium]|nr:tetratricopeptide repeat protein [Oscillospiraceae bacterium]
MRNVVYAIGAEEEFGYACAKLGLAYYKNGDYQEALEWYEKALPIYEKTHGADHPKTANVYNNIGCVHFNQGHYTDAMLWFLKAYKIRLNKFGEEHRLTQETKCSIRRT